MDRRIYVVVAGTVQVPVALVQHAGHVHPDLRKGLRTVNQPLGRQVAQACHVVSKLRWDLFNREFNTPEKFNPSVDPAPHAPITTIILQCRNSAELGHVHYLLFRKKLNPVIFSDTNPEYGAGFEAPTAVAVLATQKQVRNTLDYLPLFLKDVK